MPLNSISKDSEASNSPKPSRTSRTLQQRDADNVILILKQKLLLDLEKKGDHRSMPDTGCQMEIFIVSS